MDSIEFNKFAGAVLGSLLFVVVLWFIGEAMFHVEEPEVAGFSVEVAETGTGGEEAVEEEAVPLPVLLANASADDGANAARACAACHTFEQGGANRVGPNLWGVVGGPKAHLDNFGYSDALAAAGAEGGVWGWEELDGFLANPRGYLEGTTMGFAGVNDPEDRADILLYMNSLSDSPIDLPAAEEAADAGDTAAEDTAAAEPASEEATADSAAAEPATDDAATDASATDAAADDTAATEDAASDDAASDTAAAEGTASDEATTDDSAAADTGGDTGTGGIDPELAARLASASVEEGQAGVRACMACHTFDQGGPNRVGPNLWGIVGAPIAHLDDYSYSPVFNAANEAGRVWDWTELDAYMEDPRGHMDGTKMAFPGIRDADDRADVLVYLNSLSETPLDIPAAQ